MDNLEDAARDVFSVAGNGRIVVTDPTTESTELVGFFIPAFHINRLGRMLNLSQRERNQLTAVAPPTEYMPNELMSAADVASLESDPDKLPDAGRPYNESDFWVGLLAGLLVAIVVALLFLMFGCP